MDNSLQHIDPGLIAVIRASFGEKGIIKPFVKEIFLLELHVAGTSHLDLKAIEPTLTTNSLLHFFREPGNEHDPLAIKICTAGGRKIGYIPRDRNEVMARLMDGGKLLFGVITNKEWLGEWLKISIRCYMRDY